MAMTTSVKRILFRRSATRNMFRRRDSIGSDLLEGNGAGTGGSNGRQVRPPSLPVCERVPPGGRAPSSPGRLHGLRGTPGGPDRLGGGRREGVDTDGQRPVDLAPAEHFYETMLVHQTAGPERLGRHLGAGFEAVEV